MEGGVNLTISIIDDDIFEDTESFEITITNVESPAVVGKNCTTRIVILDDGKSFFYQLPYRLTQR